MPLCNKLYAFSPKATFSTGSVGYKFSFMFTVIAQLLRLDFARPRDEV
jgi:hypothetical protein